MALVLACGCDAAFGLAPTRPIDAAYFDAIDAPFSCPPPVTPPRFSSSFRQIVFQNCGEYTASITANRALASCMPGTTIEEADLDKTMRPAAGFQDPQFDYSYPRLAPDGDRAVVHVYDKQNLINSFAEFTRDATGWTKLQDISPGFAIRTSTAPTRGSRRHLFVLAASLAFHELVDQGGGWVDHTTHSLSELGITGTGFDFNWTPDGLRLVFTGTLVGGTTSQVLYASRATIDDPFSTAVPLQDIDFAPPGFLTEDCGRYYFNSFGSVFYAPRE